MYASRVLHSVVLSALLSALALTPRFALAATFTLHTVDSTESENFSSGDDLGNFVINATGSTLHPCGWAAAHCFKVGSVGSTSSYYTTTAPALGKGAVSGSRLPTRPDLGPAWDVTGELGSIFAATYSAGGLTLRGIFDGTNPLTDYLGKGSIDGGLVSEGGSVYFDDGFNNTLVVALDTSVVPTPEPGTMTLIGSGCSGLLTLLSRRRRRA